jgi:hypothetical protein
MRPIDFHPREAIFTSEDPGIEPLPALPITYGDGGRGIISCWKPSLKDVLRVLIGKPVYLVLLTLRQPPVYLSTDREEVMGRPNEQWPDMGWDGRTEIGA